MTAKNVDVVASRDMTKIYSRELWHKSRMVARPQANDFAFGGHFDPPFSRYDFRMSDGKKVEGKELAVR